MLGDVLVTVPDPGLAKILNSESLILDTWRDAARDVMALLQSLRPAATLAEALAVGLIALAAAPVTLYLLELGHRRARVVALGRRSDGTEVCQPCEHPDDVVRLEVREVRVTDLVPVPG